MVFYSFLVPVPPSLSNHLHQIPMLRVGLIVASSRRPFVFSARTPRRRGPFLRIFVVVATLHSGTIRRCSADFCFFRNHSDGRDIVLTGWNVGGLALSYWYPIWKFLSVGVSWLVFG